MACRFGSFGYSPIAVGGYGYGGYGYGGYGYGGYGYWGIPHRLHGCTIRIISMLAEPDPCRDGSDADRDSIRHCGTKPVAHDGCPVRLDPIPVFDGQRAK